MIDKFLELSNMTRCWMQIMASNQLGAGRGAMNIESCEPTSRQSQGSLTRAGTPPDAWPTDDTHHLTGFQLVRTHFSVLFVCILTLILKPPSAIAWIGPPQPIEPLRIPWVRGN